MSDSPAKTEDMRTWAFFLLGVTLYAVGLTLFLLPNKIAAGGISGVATVLSSFIPVNVATIIFCINLPLLILSIFVKGWRFTRNTIIGSWLYTAMVYFTSGLPALSSNPIAASLFGGAIYGAGMALLVMGNGSTGGTDLITRMLVVRFPGISVGKMAFMVESGVIIFAMISYQDIELGLYAILTIYVCAVFADKFLRGFSQGNLCFIITEKEPAQVAEPLVGKLGCAVTRLNGYGMRSGSERSILLTAVRPTQVHKVKHTIVQTDDKAFVVVVPATEMLGGHFTPFLSIKKP